MPEATFGRTVVAVDWGDLQHPSKLSINRRSLTRFVCIGFGKLIICIVVIDAAGRIHFKDSHIKATTDMILLKS